MHKDDIISQRLIRSRLFLPPPPSGGGGGTAYVFQHNYIHGFLREAFFHLEMRLTRWPVVCRHDNVVKLHFCGVNREQLFIHLPSLALIHLLGVCPSQGCWSHWDKLNKMTGCLCGSFNFEDTKYSHKLSYCETKLNQTFSTHDVWQCHKLLKLLLFFPV